jgi:hypothetical protein
VIHSSIKEGFDSAYTLKNKEKTAKKQRKKTAMPNPENLIGKEFKKGQSGNPKGRPKGVKNRSTIARQWLSVEEEASNPITGKIEKLSQEDIITLQQIKKARKGDTNSYKALLDSSYGLPGQQTDLTTNGESLNIPKIEFFKSED